MNQRQRKLLVTLVRAQSEKKHALLVEECDAGIKDVKRVARNVMGVTKLEADINRHIKASVSAMDKARDKWEKHISVKHGYDHTFTNRYSEGHWTADPDYTPSTLAKIKKLRSALLVRTDTLASKTEAAVMSIELSGSELDITQLVTNLDLSFKSDLANHLSIYLSAV